MLRMLSDRNGNFGLYTALLAPVLIGVAGLAVDFSQAIHAKMDLQNAADAAVLSVVSQGGSAMVEAYSLPDDGELTLSGKKLEAFFKGSSSDMVYAPYFKVAKVQISKKAGQVTARMTYEATIPTSLLTVLGKDQIRVAGFAQATSTLQNYQDFFLLLDNSPSMGVAATSADIQRMEAATGAKKCAFACHTTQQPSENTYAIARANGIKLRIDALKDAIAAMIETAGEQKTFDRQYRIAMYSFGDSIGSAKVTKFADLSYPEGQLAEKSAELQLMTLKRHGENRHQGSAIYKALDDLGGTIGFQGDGLSAATSKKTVLLVTDGVEDSNRRPCSKPVVPGVNGSCQEPLNTKICDEFKQRGIDVAVMYTTYLPLPDDPWYQQWIRPFQEQISTQLEKCASPGMFIEASFNHDLAAQLNILFQKTIGGARLTQ